MPGNGAAGASYGDLLVTSLLVLGAVCIAAFVVVRLAGRLLATGRSRGAHLLDVVARLPLEPRRSLYVVEVAGKTLLVGTSEMGLSVLVELDRDEVRSRAAPQPSFGELVRKAWLRRAARRTPPPERGAMPGEPEPDDDAPSDASSPRSTTPGAPPGGASSPVRSSGDDRTAREPHAVESGNRLR
jgi:flagellar protein FliO/FliZ